MNSMLVQAKRSKKDPYTSRIDKNIINAMKELPTYYRDHIKKGLELGKLEIKDQKEEDLKKYKTY